jgi:hypothetical protein
LNIFNFVLEFQYELSIDDDIRIYNGINWTVYNTNSKIGNFNEIMLFNFRNNCWRISTSNIQNKIILKNIKITIRDDDVYQNFNNKKKLLLIGGQTKLTKDFDQEDIKLINCFNDNYCYYIKKYFIQKYDYHVYNIPLSERTIDLSYLDGIIDFDFVIDINQRGLQRKGMEFYDKLKSKTKIKN